MNRIETFEEESAAVNLLHDWLYNFLFCIVAILTIIPFMLYTSFYPNIERTKLIKLQEGVVSALVTTVYAIIMISIFIIVLYFFLVY